MDRAQTPRMVQVVDNVTSVDHPSSDPSFVVTYAVVAADVVHVYLSYRNDDVQRPPPTQTDDDNVGR